MVASRQNPSKGVQFTQLLHQVHFIQLLHLQHNGWIKCGYGQHMVASHQDPSKVVQFTQLLLLQNVVHSVLRGPKQPSPHIGLPVGGKQNPMSGLGGVPQSCTAVLWWPRWPSPGIPYTHFTRLQWASASKLTGGGRDNLYHHTGQ